MWRRALLACALGLWTGDAATLSLRRSPSVFHDCTCACCVVSDPITKSAPVPTHDKKCLPPAANTGKRCSDLCSAKDSILATAKEDAYGQNLVSYNRFCYLECKPPSCGAPIGQLVTCKPLAPDQVGQATAPDGNGQGSNPNGC
mmetsp:Transcript_60401/g.177153  ORF Transcript_60401/g.177153 Transcript_60401/m.177153 type:complete len:144 (-) Transcript_60401:63-494(-)